MSRSSSSQTVLLVYILIGMNEVKRKDFMYATDMTTFSKKKHAIGKKGYCCDQKLSVLTDPNVHCSFITLVLV